ncbi:MAG: TIGR03905 family TSCPD domain-containing protein [Christensenellales bacterium]|nr:TIGR03905 family TSCPD domain-containing protein [Christensenellales bacterium]
MNTYKTHGTCSRSIEFEVNNGVLTDCRFNGGCMGNTQGVAALVKGMKVEDVISRLKGIPCGMRGTSCPDQLACALEQYLQNNG